jgi:hypothetical protein
MMSKQFKTVFLILFAILYISVAFVSTFHAISFFSLANSMWIAVMLAITFEIGQAAVLFSILTGASGKSKIIPWALMIVLTLVQVLGNVYSSYEYLITNSAELLRYFKEPIFVWTDLPDKECNVILTYIIGAILPIVSLLMTSMVTNYIGKEEPVIEKKDDDTRPVTTIDKPIETRATDTAKSIEPVLETNDKEEEIVEETEKIEEKETKPSKFINLN